MSLLTGGGDKHYAFGLATELVVKGARKPLSGAMRLIARRSAVNLDYGFSICVAITATALIAAIGNGHRVRRGRDLSAWIGVVPRECTTGGKQASVDAAAAATDGRT